MDGGAWWATDHGVTKSQTWLSSFTFTFHLSWCFANPYFAANTRCQSLVFCISVPRAGKQALAWLQVESLSNPSGKLRAPCRQVKSMAQLRPSPEQDSSTAVLQQSPIYEVKQIKSALPPLWSSTENLRKAEHVDKDDAALKVRESWESCCT